MESARKKSRRCPAKVKNCYDKPANDDDDQMKWSCEMMQKYDDKALDEGREEKKKKKKKRWRKRYTA